MQMLRAVADDRLPNLLQEVRTLQQETRESILRFVEGEQSLGCAFGNPLISCGVSTTHLIGKP